MRIDPNEIEIKSVTLPYSVRRVRIMWRARYKDMEFKTQTIARKKSKDHLTRDQFTQIALMVFEEKLIFPEIV